MSEQAGGGAGSVKGLVVEHTEARAGVHWRRTSTEEELALFVGQSLLAEQRRAEAIDCARPELGNCLIAPCVVAVKSVDHLLKLSGFRLRGGASYELGFGFDGFEGAGAGGVGPSLGGAVPGLVLWADVTEMVGGVEVVLGCEVAGGFLPESVSGVWRWSIHLLPVEVPPEVRGVVESVVAGLLELGAAVTWRGRYGLPVRLGDLIRGAEILFMEELGNTGPGYRWEEVEGE